MRSPLATYVAVVLACPTALVLVIFAYLWYLDEYYVPDVPPISRERVQHPGDHRVARQALDRLDALPAAEREALLAGLRGAIMPLATWLAKIDRAGFSLLCLGEDHEAHTRRFLADRVIPALRLDVLHLETTPPGLADVERRLGIGRDYAPLLGADIAGIIRAARRANPAVAVTAVEETERQGKDRFRTASGSREDSLVANLEAAFVPGARNAVLMGALHCTGEADWLYERVRGRLAPDMADGAINLRILGEHQYGPLEAFVYFLDEAGIAPGDFAIADPGALPAILRGWFPLLWHETFGRYGAVLVFRVESPPGG